MSAPAVQRRQPPSRRKGDHGLSVVVDQGLDENHQRFRPRLLNAGEGRFIVTRMPARSGDAGENTVQKSDARIGRGTSSGNRLQRGAKKRIQAVKNSEKFRRRRARCADWPMSAA